MSLEKQEEDAGLRTPDNRFTTRDVEKLTVTQLRAKLKSLKLPVYGCKRTLCQRLLMTSSDAASQISRNNFPLFDASQTQHSHHSTQSSIADCKLVELRERCKKVGLPSAGRKQELVDRLEVYYEKALFSDLIEPKPDPFIDWPRENLFFHESSSNENLFGPPLSTLQIDPYTIEDESELAKYSKQNLKQVCKRLNLRVSGKKDDVVKRIWLHVSQSKSSLMIPKLLEPAESKRKRMKPSLSDSFFDEQFEPSLKTRLRSNSASRRMPEIENSFTSDSLNDRLHLPLSRRYYVFSTKFEENRFICSVCCSTECIDKTCTVEVGEKLVCSCQESDSTFMCQHLLFVFLRILKISSDNALLTKTKLLPAEVDFVLKGLRQAVKSVKSTKSIFKKRLATRNAGEDGNTMEVIRENWAGKDCGLCFEPLSSNDSMIWCRVNCGKNMHTLCYERWLEHKQETDENKCPYCLMPWSFIPKNTRFQSKITTNRVDWKY